MATMILTAVGTAVGGPLGGMIGATIGGMVDRKILAPKARQGPRLADLAIQGSSYGEPIARLYGLTRVAGQIIWSTGLRERSKQSGGKSTGGRTTTYSYSASFAVLLSGRPILGVRRIWADGKLLRGASGSVNVPATIRIYRGTENQQPDPLIAAAEGPGNTPAYRGHAYVVFDDLQLADFANRIPNLTFEVEADAGEAALHRVIDDLCTAGGVSRVDTSAVEGHMAGFGVGRAASVRAMVEALDQIEPLSLRDDGSRLVFASGVAADAIELPMRDLGVASGERHVEQRKNADALPGEVSVAFLDPARDYQPGLQRARRAVVGEVRAHYETAAALGASDAKRMAERLLADAWTMRVGRKLRLPWRHGRIAPGDIVADGGDVWRVRGWTMEAMAILLDLERVRDGASPPPPADSGRGLHDVDAPHGDTRLDVLDLPPLTGTPPTTPRLWLAAGGQSAGWRRAELLASIDGGATYETIAGATTSAAIGMARTLLSAGPTECWDRRHSVEVELIGDAMWLESRTAKAVLAGANLALLGNELVQFASAVAIGPRRFLLSGLLRGRRGTEAAIEGHVVNERFILVDTGSLVPFDAPPNVIGGVVGFKALSPHQAATEVSAQSVPVHGQALRPLAPVHLRAMRLMDGALRFSWVRRSRQGFDWLDGSDVPLAEEREAYVMTISAGSASRTVEVGGPSFIYALEAQIADTGAPVSAMTLRVAQVSALVGLGEPAVRSFDVPII